MLDLSASTLIGVSIQFRTTFASTSENDLLHILSGVTCNIANISLLAKSLVGCADLFWLLHVIQSCSWHLASVSKPLAFRASRNSSSVKSTCSVISEWLRIRTGPLLPSPSPSTSCTNHSLTSDWLMAWCVTSWRMLYFCLTPNKSSLAVLQKTLRDRASLEYLQS